MDAPWPRPLTFALLALCAEPCFAKAQALQQPTAPTIHAAAEAYSPAAGTPLATRLAELLRDAPVARAHWGIAVTTMDGMPLYGLDEAKLFRPASTAKLFTTAAAMAILGPESTVNTEIVGQLDRASGTVNGDLVLVGGGDPSFGTSDLPYRASSETSAAEATAAADAAARDLAALTHQLTMLGVHSIHGNILGDDTLFSPEPPPEGWAEEDLLWGYGALPSALSIGDNQLLVSVTPLPLAAAQTGGYTSVRVEQIVPYLHITNEVTTVTGSVEPADSLTWQRSQTDPAAVTIYGRITARHPAIREHIALPDPAQYAAQALAAQLLADGVQIGGKAMAFHAPPPRAVPFLRGLKSVDPCGQATLGQEPEDGTGCAISCGSAVHPKQVLAEHTSSPLKQEIAFTLKTSANVHAEVLLHRLGHRTPCPGTTTLDGARVLRAWLLKAGLPEGDVLLFDGSGLSTKDLVTPRAEAQLLAYAARQPWFTSWKAALPIGGVDGTLASRFMASPLRGHVFAKTGTLGESRALAGYVHCASGREVIFAILDDNHEPGSSVDRVAMDRVVEAIAAYN